MIAPLGGPYADFDRAKKRLAIPDSDTTRDDEIMENLLSASDAINRWCGRQFGKTDVATERTYYSSSLGVDIDDAWTTDGMVINGGAYVGSTYRLVGGVRDGVPGWPYTGLRYAAALHPILLNVATSEITVAAKWGWAEVPPGVQQACLMLAADDFKSGDAPFGVAGFGDYVVRIRANPKVAEKLAPYTREPAKVAS